MKMDRRIPRSLDEMSDLSSLVAPPAVVTRSVTVGGRRATLRVESTIWEGLKAIALRQGKTLDGLCGEIHAAKSEGIPFVTSVRVFVLNQLRDESPNALAIA